LIELEGVTLGYGRRKVLSSLSFSIRQGEFFGIVGANGSGKTTLLRAILGILPPLQGRILFHALQQKDHPTNSQPAATRFGYVPQRELIDDIFPLTALEITLMGRYGALGPLQRPSSRDRSAAAQRLDQVGLGDLAHKQFRELSGGQKQRVLIARALTAEAQVLAFDEPTNGMDLEGEQAILDLIRRLQQESRLTVLFVSHMLNLIANSADRLLLLHEGRVRLGDVDEILSAEVLQELYGVAVVVQRVGSKRVIVP
jgi:ABC-type Mn2+/Zn2+ transport system ATPase subunit